MDGCLYNPRNRIETNGTHLAFLPLQEWDPTDISVMQQRLEALRRLALANTIDEDDTMEKETSIPSPNSTPLAPGWRIADTTWRPCPIGAFSAA